MITGGFYSSPASQEMAKTLMFLTFMPGRSRSSPPPLEALVARLRPPPDPVVGRQAGTLALPDNIICFQHRRAVDLNQPRHGRALHHRYVLIFALRTAVTVVVDDRPIRLKAGEGLLVLPFQFHHYTDPAAEAVQWFFVTFDHPKPELLEPLRFQPFAVKAPLRALLAEIVDSYLHPGREDMLSLLLGLLLARLRSLDPAHHRPVPAPAAPELATKVNLLAQRAGETPRVRELARELGISTSHLRARFRASCQVSLGRHLRRLRLEKACGLLRLSRDRVTEVAEQCGFNSVYAFSRAFRRAFGMSPLDYRRQQGVGVRTGTGA
jgi:AraC-like DNA-binding protein